jgi:hypothetical protein
MREQHRLRMVFGLRRDKVTRQWRRLHDKKPYVLYSSPNIMLVIKSIIMR